MTDLSVPAPPRPSQPVPVWKDYHRLTRTGTYGFLAALPLLALYEGLILLVNTGPGMSVRVGADVWIKQFLAAFGATGMLVMGGVVLLVGLGIVFRERKQHLAIRPRYFLWMLGESAVYAVLSALLVSKLVGLLFAMALAGPQGVTLDWPTELALSLGAGLYEELVFRVLLVGGLFALMKRFRPQQPLGAYIAAALVGALLFSAVHYTGALGDAFTLDSFTFRFLFGLLLNALFLLRGFGIAAWTHALYDVLVVTVF
jgi:hypothetical protein